MVEFTLFLDMCFDPPQTTAVKMGAFLYFLSDFERVDAQYYTEK
jgi:hypothetical protein